MNKSLLVGLIIGLVIGAILSYGVGSTPLAPEIDVSQYQSRIDQLEGEVSSLQSKVVDHQTQLGEKEGQVGGLQAQISDLQIELNEKSGQLTQNDARIKELEQEIEELENQVNTLQEKLSSKLNETRELEIQRESLLSQIWEIQGKLSNLTMQFNGLKSSHENLVSKYDILSLEQSEIFKKAPSNHTIVTFIYHTNFGGDRHIITLNIPWDTYMRYRYLEPHPYTKDSESLDIVKSYITSNEAIIMQIASTIRSQTKSEEELADALLDFVQDKGYTLSIRYYLTYDFKYPVETLVEMGGDCDTHAFLYASLMKAAGFKILILFFPSNEHIAVAVQLTNPPTHNTQPEYHGFTYKGEKYYFAETTYQGWKVGDMPQDQQNQKFYIVPI